VQKEIFEVGISSGRPVRITGANMSPLAFGLAA
jgi:hypothetical protein